MNVLYCFCVTALMFFIVTDYNDLFVFCVEELNYFLLTTVSSGLWNTYFYNRINSVTRIDGGALHLLPSARLTTGRITFLISLCRMFYPTTIQGTFQCQRAPFYISFLMQVDI